MRRFLSLFVILMGLLVSAGAQSSQDKAPGFDPSPGPGLTVNIATGKMFCDGTQISYVGGSVLLSNNSTNYIVLDTTNACAFNVKTTGFLSTDVPIATVQTSNGVIVAFQDSRPRFWSISGGYPGVSSDGANGAKVQGQITAAQTNTVYNPCMGTGLKCDGSTDDSAALQSFMNTLCSGAGTDSVSLPNTPIALAHQVVLYNNCSGNLHLYGTGTNAGFIFTATDSNGSGLVIENNTSNAIELDHFNITGPASRALAISDSSNVYVHDVEVQGAATTATGGLPAAIYVQGGSHIHIDHNKLTGNGPETGSTSCTNALGAAVVCPLGYTFVANTNYFAGQPLSTSTTEDLEFTRNVVTGNNTQIAVVGFGTNHSVFSGNYVDENNAYQNDTTPRAEAGQGYGINIYGQEHVGGTSSNWVSTARSSGVVTTTMTANSVIPYVVGQWVCSNGVSVITATDFSGCFQIASVAGSGGSTPTFTWNQPGANESISGIDIVNAVVGTTITNNHVRNAAGSCIYTQSMVDGHVDENQTEYCGQMMPSTQIPQDCINVLGATRVTVNNNNCNTAVTVNPSPIVGQTYSGDGIDITLGYNTTASGNTVVHFNGTGIGALEGNGINIIGNTIDGAATGQFGVHVPANAALSNVTIAKNFVRGTTYCGVCTGGGTFPAWAGYGFLIDANNVAGNNSTTTATSYGIQILYPVQSPVIVGNVIAPFSLYGTSYQSLDTGVYTNAVNPRISRNTVNSISCGFYAFEDGGATFAEWEGNTVYNSCQAFAGTSSGSGRIFNNLWGTASSAPVFTYNSGNYQHWDNQFTNGASSGICTLASGTCTVSTHEIQNGDLVKLTRQAAGSAPGELSLGTITAGTSFIVNSSNGSDNGTVLWEIKH